MERKGGRKPLTSTSATWPSTTASKRPVTSRPFGATSEIPREAIAMAAYYRWLKRGCPDGQDQEDWFAAERELRQQTAR